MIVQVIKQDDRPEWAVIPYETYLDLVEKAEMLQDIQDYDNVKAALAAGEEETIPAGVVNALLGGENAIKVWRTYRQLAQAVLAEKAGISVPYLSQLEKGRRKGSLKVLSAITRALNVDLDLIAPD